MAMTGRAEALDRCERDGVEITCTATGVSAERADCWT